MLNQLLVCLSINPPHQVRSSRQQCHQAPMFTHHNVANYHIKTIVWKLWCKVLIHLTLIFCSIYCQSIFTFTFSLWVLMIWIHHIFPSKSFISVGHNSTYIYSFIYKIAGAPRQKRLSKLWKNIIHVIYNKHWWYGAPCITPWIQESIIHP